MTKLQNISGLLVANNSTYAKDVVVTTKTTRAELTKMLQATDSALAEALPLVEGYINKVEELAKSKAALEEQKSDLLSQVGKLNREVIELKDERINLEGQKEKLHHEVYELKESNSKLEEQAVKLKVEISTLATKWELENARNQRAERKVEALQEANDKLMNRSFFERLFNK